MSDILFPWAIHNLRGISGDFWFGLTIESLEDPLVVDDLQGTIHIYKSKDDWRSTAEPVVRNAIININDLRLSPEPNRAQQILSEFNSARDELDNSADIKLTFKLLRTGEVFFSKPTYADEALEYASNDYAEHCEHDFPKWVADQAYFFLRDVSHTHQHHDPYSDTILILQTRDAADIEWRKRIIYSLHYAIISAKRSRETFSAFRSGGIQAYCMSFQAICVQKLGEQVSQMLPQFNNDALTRSLESKSQELMAVMEIRFARAANKRTFGLAAVALVIAALAVLVQPRIGSQSDRDLFPTLHEVSDVTTEYLFEIVFLLALGIGIVWLVTRADWMLRNKLGRDILELANVRRRKTAAGLILVSLVVLGIAVYCFWPAVAGVGKAVKEFMALFYS